jgi:hypothetical protein
MVSWLTQPSTDAFDPENTRNRGRTATADGGNLRSVASGMLEAEAGTEESPKPLAATEATAIIDVISERRVVSNEDSLDYRAWEELCS